MCAPVCFLSSLVFASYKSQFMGTIIRTDERRPLGVRIVCISDTHGRHGDVKVPDGDILVEIWQASFLQGFLIANPQSDPCRRFHAFRKARGRRVLERMAWKGTEPQLQRRGADPCFTFNSSPTNIKLSLTGTTRKMQNGKKT